MNQSAVLNRNLLTFNKRSRVGLFLCFILFISVLIRQTTGAPNVQVNFVNNLVASVSIDQVIPVGAVSEVSDDGNLEKNSKTAVFDEVKKSNKENYKKYHKKDVYFIFEKILFFQLQSKFIQSFGKSIAGLQRFLETRSTSPPFVSNLKTFTLQTNLIITNGIGAITSGIKKYYGVRGLS